jgi:thioredoxin reductase
MDADVIVIGGSYSGMAAALQLLRARRQVLIIDAGLRRNRNALHSNGFLTQDGVDPAEIALKARAQLARYPTLQWHDGEAMEARGKFDDFTVALADGRSFTARRLLFATGVHDELPDVAGLSERWGRSVFHCPYCHGYELDNGALGVIAAGPMSVHQAAFLPEWGTVTLLTDERLQLDADQQAELAARGVRIENEPIAQLEGNADVRLRDGRLLSFAGLFTAPRNRPSTPVAERLGCRLEETPFGVQIATDTQKQTSINGAFACGDSAKVPHSVSLAVADGAWAGAQIHRSLVF